MTSVVSGDSYSARIAVWAGTSTRKQRWPCNKQAAVSLVPLSTVHPQADAAHILQHVEIQRARRPLERADEQQQEEQQHWRRHAFYLERIPIYLSSTRTRR